MSWFRKKKNKPKLEPFFERKVWFDARSNGFCGKVIFWPHWNYDIEFASCYSKPKTSSILLCYTREEVNQILDQKIAEAKLAFEYIEAMRKLDTTERIKA